jgi:hypothetical protein
MHPRYQPFLTGGKVGGAVTRFAVVDCRLDLTLGVAVLRVALEWVLSKDDFALAAPWQASFYKRDESGHTATVAVVEVSADNIVGEGPPAQGSQYPFHVEVEFELPLAGRLPRLEATIRLVESGMMRTPVGDMFGYADTPDLDPEDGAFAPEVTRWLQRGNVPADGGLDSLPMPAGKLPEAPSPVRPLTARVPNAPISMPAGRTASTDSADAATALGAPQAAPLDAAVFCPPNVGRATAFLVQAHLYPPAQAEQASARAREADSGADRRGVLSLPLDLPGGTRIDLRLEMPGFRVDEPDTVLIWRGALAAAQFEVAVPDDAALGKVIGRIRFSIAGVPAGTLRFQVIVTVRATGEPARAAEVGVRRYRRAFVSYSSKDRAEVLRRVQAFRIAGLSVFQDVLDLEPGDRWERELYREIDDCDVVLLFWSRAAAESAWVAKEIDYALARKQGQDDRPPDIQPVPIEGPPIPTPPEKLRHLHFNDALLAHITAAQRAH